MILKPARSSSRLALVAFVSPALFITLVRADITDVWSGNDKNWGNSHEWSAGVIPNNNIPDGALYDVSIAAGNITLQNPVTIQTFDWTGGTLFDQSVTVVGGITIGHGEQDLNGTTLINAAGQLATFAVGGGDYLTLGEGAQFINNGNFLSAGGLVQSDSYDPAPAFINNGNFTCAVTTGGFRANCSINIAFDNQGTVNLTNGFLQLNFGDLNHTTGSFVTAAGTKLTFGNNFKFLASSSISGAGNIIFLTNATVAGTYNVTGTSTFSNGQIIFNNTVDNLGANTVFANGTVTFNADITNNSLGNATFSGAHVYLNTPNTPDTLSASSATISAGYITGYAPLSVNGLLTFTGGTLNLRTTAAGGLAINGSANGTGIATLYEASLTIPASQSATIGSGGNVTLSLSTYAQLLNAGTFTALNGQITNGGGSSLAFTNTGSFSVALANASQAFTIAVPFLNSGQVNVQAGRLALTAGDGGSSHGTFSISPTATLSLDGSYNFAPDASIIDSGTLSISSGKTTLAFGLANAAALSIGGTLQITAGTTSVSSFSLAGVAKKWTGTLDLSNNSLIVQTTDAIKPAALAALQDQVAFGRSYTAGIIASALPSYETLAVLDNAAIPTPLHHLRRPARERPLHPRRPRTPWRC